MKLEFVGVGPMRAGTTWLHAALSRHPLIVLPREKETFFFDRNFDRGLGWYEAHFPPAPPGAVFGEIGASYFASTEARERIFALSPEARILVSVRDPVERAYSTFVHLKKTRALPSSLEEAIALEPAILGSGEYSKHLPAWEARFGRDRVELVTMDEVVERPHEALTRVLASLALPPLEDSAPLGERVNDAYVPPSRRLHRVRAGLFRYLVDNQHFRTLNAARALKRAALRITPARPRAPRPMSEQERALLADLLAAERAYLSERLGRR